MTEKSVKELNEVDIFTDGSCINLGHKSICGYAVHFPNGEYKDIGKPFTHEPLTNQRSELYAVYRAIRRVYKKNKEKNIMIYSDSEYTIKSMTLWINVWKVNGWKTANKKPVMNQDIIIKIDKIMSKHKGEIKFKHVKAHTGRGDYESIHNDVADRLAKYGAQSSK